MLYVVQLLLLLLKRNRYSGRARDFHHQFDYSFENVRFRLLRSDRPPPPHRTVKYLFAI